MGRQAGTGNTRIWKEDPAGSDPRWRVAIVTLPNVGKWRVDCYQEGHRGERGDDGGTVRDLGSKTVSTVDEAEKHAAAAWRAAHKSLVEVASEVKLRTLRDMADMYLAREDVREGTKDRYTDIYRWVFEHLDPKMAPSALTRALVQTLTTDKMKIAPTSRQLAVNAVKGMYTYARQQGLWKGENPAEGVTVKIEKRSDLLPYLAKEHFQTFLEKALDINEDFSLKAAFALYTGFRESEIWHMRHEWVREVMKPDGTTMLLIDVPSKDPRTGWKPKTSGVFPLSSAPHALKVYEEAKRVYGVGTPGKDYVFQGGPDVSQAATLCDSIAVKAGVPLQGVPSEYIRGLRFHALRDSAAVRWLSKDVPIYVISALLRHASVKTTEEHYVSARARFNYDVKGL